MNKFRTYSAVIFLLLFGWYFSNINLFPHFHSVQGNSVIHSHFGGTTEHDHSDNGFAVIDLLSNLQTTAAESIHIHEVFFCLVYEVCSEPVLSQHEEGWSFINTLRGPPQL
jgi:hypothetical protein